jgi:hypothetical protein
VTFALIIIGLFMLITGVRGTHGELAALLKDDFTGENNYLKWVLAMLVVGSLGYIRPIRPVANGILALVIMTLFLSNKGFFAKLTEQLGVKSK